MFQHSSRGVCVCKSPCLTHSLSGLNNAYLGNCLATRHPPQLAEVFYVVGNLAAGWNWLSMMYETVCGQVFRSLCDKRFGLFYLISQPGRTKWLPPCTARTEAQYTINKGGQMTVVNQLEHFAWKLRETERECKEQFKETGKYQLLPRPEAAQQCRPPCGHASPNPHNPYLIPSSSSAH